MEIDVDNLLEKYFFNSEYHTSCSVVLPNFDKNDVEESSIAVEQSKVDTKEDINTGQFQMTLNNFIDDSKIIQSHLIFQLINILIEDIDNFFASNRGQIEKHTL